MLSTYFPCRYKIHVHNDKYLSLLIDLTNDTKFHFSLETVFYDYYSSTTIQIDPPHHEKQFNTMLSIHLLSIYFVMSVHT